MMMKLGKKSALTLAALAMPLVLTGCANVLRVAPHAELKVFDPVWTTAYITRNHGYLIYDTLFAMDENFEPQPQMVDKWTVSADNKTWTFTLREGLKWHDGTDVTARDCVASIRRWQAKDGGHPPTEVKEEGWPQAVPGDMEWEGARRPWPAVVVVCAAGTPTWRPERHGWGSFCERQTGCRPRAAGALPRK